MELIRLFVMYYIYDDIYLIHFWDGNKMWKIGVDQIIEGIRI